MDFEAVADELYAARPDAFTGLRDERAAQAREEGDRKLAASIKALRKPTLSAWACNLLVRERQEEIEPLLGLGEALRQAHLDLDGGSLRELSRQQNLLVAALARQAVELTAAAGHRVGEGAREEVEGTLRAVLADPEAAGAWAEGRLAKPLTAAPGFAAALGGAAPPDLRLVPPPDQVAEADEPPSRGRAAPRGGDRSAAKDRRAREREAAGQEAAEREAAEREAAEQKAAEREAAERKAAEERRREREAARREAAEAARALAEAEEAAADADREAREASDRVGDLKRRVAELEQELRAARAGTRTAEADQRAAHDRAREAARSLGETRRRAATAEARAERLAGRED
ncbi:hypothetical protein [Streptomyces sp. NPDC005012]|uniref:hypothetical protein n=1 Tax=Streptomyces sp. NPDC005012 TaxID=3154558 RepID=UPI0033B509D3